MIRLSIGTAIELGIIKNKSDIPTTTAYVMIGDKCNNNCAFCSQSVESSTRKDKLSRVIWPEYTKEEILEALKNYKDNNISRICIQSMANETAHCIAYEFIEYIKNEIDMPISLSAKVEKLEDVEKFFSLGIDKIGIAIDAANQKLYEQIKGNNYYEKINFIIDIGKKYPGRISTHIIAGLGESHKDIYDLYKYLTSNNITVSLFAFTPVRGTKMENVNQPSIESYRRVQLMTYMIDRGYSDEYFVFENEYLQDVELDEDMIKSIDSGYPFEIKGCKDCNRPYYNERPGSVIYNYSKALNVEEVILAKSEINLEIIQ